MLTQELNLATPRRAFSVDESVLSDMSEVLDHGKDFSIQLKPEELGRTDFSRTYGMDQQMKRALEIVGPIARQAVTHFMDTEDLTIASTISHVYSYCPGQKTPVSKWHTDKGINYVIAGEPTTEYVIGHASKLPDRLPRRLLDPYVSVRLVRGDLRVDSLDANHMHSLSEGVIHRMPPKGVSPGRVLYGITLIPQKQQ